MGIFHADLENIVKEEYKFSDVLRDPLKSAYREVFHDLNYEKLFSGNRKRKDTLNDLAVFGSFIANSIPHELIHAGTNVLTGGKNKEIVLNKLFGADLVHAVYSGIDSRILPPFTGGYVKIIEHGSTMAKYAVGFAPYLMTPLGIYMVQQGKKRRSLPLAVAGSGMLLNHAGAILGDFFNVGRTVIYDVANSLTSRLGYESISDDNSLMTILAVCGGFYIGSKIMSFSYRSFKCGVNYCSGLFGEKEKYIS